MTPAELAVAFLNAARAVLVERDLDPGVLPATISVERPRIAEHGDYASNVALQVGKKAGLPPREFAAAIASKLTAMPGIASVEIAGPGFLNVRVSAAAAGGIARTVVQQGHLYGRSDVLAKERVNLEFVSANPTGPVHIGGTRWAAVGDALARLLSAVGAEVTREYYFNDAGSQIDRFARSLLAAARDEPAPEDGYSGEYIKEIADAVVARVPGAATAPDAQEIFRAEGVALMFAEIRASLEAFGVHFDVYFNEKEMHTDGAVGHALDELRKQGRVFERDGAVWLRTTDFGDDKDRVIVRSTGEFTYFAADAAYYVNKRDRGFDRLIYMLGADHHGYVGRLKALAGCAGDDPATAEVLIGQMVNLVKEGQPVRMSKRAGNVLTLEDLVDAIGVDACRYALARYSVDSPIDLDVDRWTKHTNDNPIYYVQYVGARTASVSRHAGELGHQRGDDFDPALLSHDKELELLKAIADYPAVVAGAAEMREPHRVAHYLEGLAGTYHRFYDVKQGLRIVPLGDDEFTETNRARLWLNDATRIVIENGLTLLGVSAPERM